MWFDLSLDASSSVAMEGIKMARLFGKVLCHVS
jgi:hypothetical protein